MSGRAGIRLLGPVELLVDGTPVPIGPPRARLLLALLALAAGEPVSVPELLHRAWAGNRPSTATAVLRNNVSSLRQALDDVPDVALETVEGGYRLRIDPDAVDVVAFDTLVRRACAERVAGDSAACAELVHDALEVWRGPALADLVAVWPDRPEAAELEERRLRALELRLLMDLDAGGARHVLPELDRLTREHPRRVELSRLHVLAVARSGRRVEAVTACLQARDGARTAVAQTAGTRAPDGGLEAAYQEVLSGGPEPERHTGPVRRRTDPEVWERASGLVHELRTVVVLCLRPAAGSRPPAADVVTRHGGVLEDPTDDGSVVAYFGLRTARRDDLDRAVRAALALREDTGCGPATVAIALGVVRYSRSRAGRPGMSWVSGDVVAECVAQARVQPEGSVVVGVARG